MAPPVTIAVVSWNTRDLLDRCLGSLEPEHRAGRAEVWVVDNASTDGSPDLVRERHPWAHVMASGENLGFGAAVNTVAERTTSEWIAPANADVALLPGALETMLEAGRRDPGAGAIAPRLRLPAGHTQHSVYSFPTLPFAVLWNLGIERLSPRLADRLCFENHWNAERPRRVDWAIAAFLLVRREAWNAVDGFDAGMWMYAEDLDLGWRLNRAGWPTRYEPRAVVDHESAAATRQAWGEERVARWMESTYAWMVGHRGAWRTRLYALVHVLGAWGRFLAVAGRGPAGSPETARRAELALWARRHWRLGVLRPGGNRGGGG